MAWKPTPAIPVWLIQPYGIKQSTKVPATCLAGLILSSIPPVGIQASLQYAQLSIYSSI